MADQKPTKAEWAGRIRDLGTPVLRALIVCTALSLLLLLAGIPENWLYAALTFAACWAAYITLLAVLRELLAPTNARFRVIQLGPEATVNVFLLARRLLLYSALLLPVQWSLAIVGYERTEVLLLLSVAHVTGLAFVALFTVYRAGGTSAFIPQWDGAAAGAVRRVAAVIFPLVCAGVLSVAALEAVGYVNLARYIVRVVWLNIPIAVVALLLHNAVSGRYPDGAPGRKWLGATIWLVIALLQIHVWELHVYHWIAIRDFLQRPLMTVGESRVSAYGILRALLAMGVVYVVAIALRRWLLSSAGLARAYGDGVRYALSSLTFYVFLVAGLLWAMLVGGFPLNTLTVFAGMAGIGIGFGLQDVVRNFVAGLILLIERPLAVGDFIDVEGVRGRVDTISLRSTTIRTAENVHIVVPNADFISSRVTNLTQRDLKIRLTVEVGVSYSSEMDTVKSVLEKTAADHELTLDDPPPEARIVGFGDSSVDFWLLAWIPDPEYRIRVLADLYRNVWYALQEAGIEIPFPQRDLHVRSTIVPEAVETTLTPPPAQLEERRDDT